MDIPSASPGCPTPYRTKPRVPAKIFLIRRDELNSRRGGDVQEIRGALNKSRPDIINLEPARGAVRAPLASSDPPAVTTRGSDRLVGLPRPRALPPGGNTPPLFSRRTNRRHRRAPPAVDSDAAGDGAGPARGGEGSQPPPSINRARAGAGGSRARRDKDRRRRRPCHSGGPGPRRRRHGDRT